MKTKHWIWIGVAFLGGAAIGSLTGLPLNLVGLKDKLPIPAGV